jgi:hypothetical protein
LTLPVAEAFSRLRIARRGVEKIACFFHDFLKSLVDFAWSLGILKYRGNDAKSRANSKTAARR